MSRTTYSEALEVLDRVGANYSASTTETALAEACTLPERFWQAGRVLHVVAIGAASSAASTPGNLTFNLRYGTATAGTILMGTGAQALATSQTTKTWQFETWITCRSTGTTGTIIAACNYVNGALSTTTLQLLPASAIATVTLDTTVATTLFFTALTSVNSASNIITLHEYIVEAWD